MAIKSVEKNGKKFYEVYVNGYDSRGRRVQRKKRGIETLRKAQATEFELKRELAKLREEKVPYRWGEWFDECVKRMRIELQPSTIAGYETQLRKWIHPHWNDVELRDISKGDIYEVIFHKCEAIPTAYTRRNILKMVKRIFQMAVEEGVLDRNPCTGITVRVTETNQKVLTNAEVDIFLREASLAHHRFYPVWVVALLTGMRSGELFAPRWTDIDFDQKLISVTRQWTSKNGFCATKTRRSRIVPISDDLHKFLIERKLKVGAESEFVLPRLREWDHGEQARGESLARVMSIVGHTELKTTNGYLRKAGVELHGATDKLGYKLPSEVVARVLELNRKKRS
jgi:integrase